MSMAAVRRGLAALAARRGSVLRSSRPGGHKCRSMRSSSSSSSSAAPPGTSAEAIAEPQPELPKKELRRLFICAAVPMIGFGMMDNFIMIQAGDLIDNTLGVRFGLATLTAAACGQVVSDACGVGFGGVVDAAIVKLGLRKPLLDQAQLATSRARFISISGGVIGVVTGCLLGMTILLFKDLDAADREKEETRKEELRDTVALEVRETIGAERATLWVLDEGSSEEGPCLVGKMLETGTLLRLPISNGIAGEAARTQRTVNVVNAQKHESFERKVGQNMGFVVKQNLAVPIVSIITGKTLGVVQLLNKIGEDAFTEADIRDIERIAGFLHYELETQDLGFAHVLAVLAKQRAERNVTQTH